MKLTSLLQLVDKLQQAGKIDNLQQVCGVLDCVFYDFLKLGSHMSPMIGESLSVTIQGENSQRILLMSSHKQWSSPMSATHENQV